MILYFSPLRSADLRDGANTLRVTKGLDLLVSFRSFVPSHFQGHDNRDMVGWLFPSAKIGQGGVVFDRIF